jgi:hypothetical protein
MDPAKIQAIREWEAPMSVRDVQCFLGFANFYRRFIHRYSPGRRNILRSSRRSKKHSAPLPSCATLTPRWKPSWKPTLPTLPRPASSRNAFQNPMDQNTAAVGFSKSTYPQEPVSRGAQYSTTGLGPGTWYCASIRNLKNSRSFFRGGEDTFSTMLVEKNAQDWIILSVGIASSSTRR